MLVSAEMKGTLEETAPRKDNELDHVIISIVCAQLRETRCVMLIQQTSIDSYI